MCAEIMDNLSHLAHAPGEGSCPLQQLIRGCAMPAYSCVFKICVMALLLACAVSSWQAQKCRLVTTKPPAAGHSTGTLTQRKYSPRSIAPALQPAAV